MLNITDKKKRQLLLIVVFGLILLLFFRGIQLHLINRITDRIKFHAIPVAISALYHHHPHDYTGIKAIATPFQSFTDTETLIKNAIAQDVQSDHENYYWVADDKGFSDYVIASFYLFGPHLNSMYYMWFVILLTSVSLFLVSFHRKTWTLGFLCLVLLGMHAALSTLSIGVLDYSLSATWRDSLYSITLYEPRFLDVLALIAVFHMLILASKATAFNWLRDSGPLIGQIVIFIFLYHSRSSLGWELFAIFFYCIWRLSTKVYRKKDLKKNTYCNNSTMIVAVALCGSLLFLNGYKHAVYNPLYFAEMGQRTFWHNALMGLGGNLLLANKHQYPDDFNTAQSVIKFAKKTKLCPESVSALDPQQLLNSLGNWGVVNWVDYEKCSKKLFFKIVMTNKLSVVRLYTITKPANALSVLRIAGGKTSEPALEEIRSKYGMRWSPFNIIHTGFLIIIFSLSFKSLRRVRKQCMRMIAIVFVASFIPSVAFYPKICTTGGLQVVLPIGLYLALIFAIHSLMTMFNRYDSHTDKINLKFKDKWASTKELTIIIPAFNEENRIKITVQEVYEAAQKTLDNYEILIIDDGSKDATYSEAKKIATKYGDKIRIIRHDKNQGVGAAFLYGLTHAKFPQLCLIPGDNAYNWISIELLFTQCGLAPLVISYRKNMEERAPLRHVLSRIATLSLRIITGIKITDAHSLYLFPVEETRLLQVKSAGYGYHMEILSRLLIKLKSHIEVPVLLNPKPDTSSGVMKPKTLLILGRTLFRLYGLRILGKL